VQVIKKVTAKKKIMQGTSIRGGKPEIKLTIRKILHPVRGVLIPLTGKSFLNNRASLLGCQ
jgi:hypothetical protein